MILYNLSLVAAWSVVLFHLVQYAIKHYDPATCEVKGVYDEVKLSLQIAQTAAILEVLILSFPPPNFAAGC